MNAEEGGCLSNNLFRLDEYGNSQLKFLPKIRSSIILSSRFGARDEIGINSSLTSRRFCMYV